MSNISTSKLTQSNEILRKLRCMSYNCMTALFIRTQTEPKLYLACLFKEDSAKNELIFEPLVDKKREYKFSIEMENFNERKTKFISLRNEFKENSNDNPGSNNVNYIGSIHSTNTMALNNQQAATYLNTQNMYESSLSEELSVFDFTGNSFKSFMSPSSSFTSGMLST